jgi:hypothetical protein
MSLTANDACGWRVLAVSPAVAAVCTVNRLAVVLLGDEDEVVIASNTEQQGLVMSRVDVNVSQVTFVNFQYYDEINTSPISFKTCFFYLGTTTRTPAPHTRIAH